MNIEEIRKYCQAKPGVTEGFPFNDTALVFKVAGKIFDLLDLSEEGRGISLKRPLLNTSTGSLWTCFIL
jgi:predicted DNA-binding protein (MmcQ/YjbR family)